MMEGLPDEIIGEILILQDLGSFARNSTLNKRISLICHKNYILKQIIEKVLTKELHNQLIELSRNGYWALLLRLFDLDLDIDGITFYIAFLHALVKGDNEVILQIKKSAKKKWESLSHGLNDKLEGIWPLRMFEFSGRKFIELLRQLPQIIDLDINSNYIYPLSLFFHSLNYKQIKDHYNKLLGQLAYRIVPRYDLGKIIFDLGFNVKQIAYINKMDVNHTETVLDLHCYLKESIVLYLERNKDTERLLAIGFCSRDLVHVASEIVNVDNVLSSISITVNAYYYTLESGVKKNMLHYLGSNPEFVSETLRNLPIRKRRDPPLFCYRDRFDQYGILEISLGGSELIRTEKCFIKICNICIYYINDAKYQISNMEELPNEIIGEIPILQDLGSFARNSTLNKRISVICHKKYILRQIIKNIPTKEVNNQLIDLSRNGYWTLLVRLLDLDLDIDGITFYVTFFHGLIKANQKDASKIKKSAKNKWHDLRDKLNDKFKGKWPLVTFEFSGEKFLKLLKQLPQIIDLDIISNYNYPLSSFFHSPNYDRIKNHYNKLYCSFDYRTVPRYDLGKIICDLGFNEKQIAYINKMNLDNTEAIFDLHCYFRESILLYLGKNEEIERSLAMGFSSQDFTRFADEIISVRENMRLCLTVIGHYYTLKHETKKNMLHLLGHDPVFISDFFRNLPIRKRNDYYFVLATELVNMGYWKSALAVLN